MTLVEEILSKRELLVIIGVENHSTLYNPNIFNNIWNFPESLPSKDVLIIPVSGLDKTFYLSPNKTMCYGRSLWLLFVESSSFNNNAILFETFPQTDKNSYFTDRIKFLQKCNCKTVTICDIGVYKSRALINLLNSAISELATYNISVCLATILGYNSRGYTDIEIEDETITYQKEYYLKSDKEVSAINDRFSFIQIDRKFKISELYQLCSLTKSQTEIFLQKIKLDARAYEDTLQGLLEAGFLKIFIKSLNKGDSFDFVSLNDKLSNIGFKGDIIDDQWTITYNKLCGKIIQANQKNREMFVEELISAIEQNINTTINFLHKI